MPAQSIIVYRNPAEQWFWEGGALPVFVFVLVTLFAILGFMKLIDASFKVLKRPRYGNVYVYTQYAAIAASLVIAFFTTAKVVG